jgi:excisionase family DNA binding protein
MQAFSSSLLEVSMGESLEGQRKLVTVREAMRQLSCSKSHIYVLHRRGKLELIKLGRKFTRVTQRSIDEFLKF